MRSRFALARRGAGGRLSQSPCHGGDSRLTGGRLSRGKASRATAGPGGGRGQARPSTAPNNGSLCIRLAPISPPGPPLPFSVLSLSHPLSRSPSPSRHSDAPTTTTTSLDSSLVSVVTGRAGPQGMEGTLGRPHRQTASRDIRSSRRPDLGHPAPARPPWPRAWAGLRSGSE